MSAGIPTYNIYPNNSHPNQENTNNNTNSMANDYNMNYTPTNQNLHLLNMSDHVMLDHNNSTPNQVGGIFTYSCYDDVNNNYDYSIQCSNGINSREYSSILCQNNTNFMSKLKIGSQTISTDGINQTSVLWSYDNIELTTRSNIEIEISEEIFLSDQCLGCYVLHPLIKYSSSYCSDCNTTTPTDHSSSIQRIEAINNSPPIIHAPISQHDNVNVNINNNRKKDKNNNVKFSQSALPTIAHLPQNYIMNYLKKRNKMMMNQKKDVIAAEYHNI